LHRIVDRLDGETGAQHGDDRRIGPSLRIPEQRQGGDDGQGRAIGDGLDRLRRASPRQQGRQSKQGKATARSLRVKGRNLPDQCTTNRR